MLWCSMKEKVKIRIMMLKPKYPSAVLFFFFSLLLSYSYELGAQDFQRSVITDPSLSRRCEALLEERNFKVQNKQRLESMIVRNQGLQRVAPENKVKARKKLERHLARVQQERELTLLQIQDIEETIVRQGCPGIQL